MSSGNITWDSTTPTKLVILKSSPRQTHARPQVNIHQVLVLCKEKKHQVFLQKYFQATLSCYKL